MLKKVQTTTYPNGHTTVTVVERGIAENRMEYSIEEERRFFAKLATDPRVKSRTQTIEVAGNTLVLVYEDGRVKIIQWLADEPQV